MKEGIEKTKKRCESGVERGMGRGRDGECKVSEIIA